MEEKILLKNIDKIHTTELGINRIKKNLDIEEDIIPYCIKCIKKAKKITKQGKNFYVETNSCILTINAHSYTIITAHPLKNTLEILKQKYDRMQKKYGDKNLNAIYFGGCTKNPNICFVFMNPTGKNVAADKNWKGINAPWLGTKNIWDLFYNIELLDKEIYVQIKEKKGKEWNEDFAKKVYENVEKHKYFITNLGKCTQIDARALPNEVFEKYLNLLQKEINIIKPKIIILLGNQVSSILPCWKW